MGLLGSNDPYQENGLFNPEDIKNYYGDKFYTTGAEYWKTQAKTKAGMLGGLTYTHKADIEFSQKLLEKYKSEYKLGGEQCIEFGAGIGRITSNLLINYFHEIDLLDPVQEFLDVAKNEIGSRAVIRLYPIGAQDWIAERKYDCIWLQWTLMYLTDDDAVNILKQCKANLKEKGKIFVKDNGYPSNEETLAAWNSEDHSFARSHQSYLNLFQKAEVEILEDISQPNWDPELLPLYVFVLN